MALDEIENWMDHHIELRRNIVSGRQEYRWLENDAVEGTGPWLNYDDHTLNTLYRRMHKVKTVKRDEIDWEVHSDYVKDFNPFLDYLERLPPWNGNDYIFAHAAGVVVEGGFDACRDFIACFRKWLVAMVAAWVDPEVESLMSPLVIPFEYEGLYAQAYYLYKEGFQYWFDDSEASDRRNSRFMVPNLERQLVNRYFRLPTATDAAEFVDVATALQLFPVNVTSKIRKEAVDQAFIDQGFEPVTIDGNPGYFAIVRKPDEVRMMGLQMAYSARRAMTAESS